MKTMGISAVLILALISGAMGSDAIPEKGKVELKIIAEKEIAAAGADGKTTIQRVPAEKVIPGDEVIYTINYVNQGDKPAENLVVNNPIPDHMHYVPGSASGDDCVITFSADRGKTFDLPEKLKTWDDEGNPIPAKAADYTNIRWTLKKPVAPKGSGQVGFRARLE